MEYTAPPSPLPTQIPLPDLITRMISNPLSLSLPLPLPLPLPNYAWLRSGLCSDCPGNKAL
jgi:hypothetical protein